MYVCMFFRKISLENSFQVKVFFENIDFFLLLLLKKVWIKILKFYQNQIKLRKDKKREREKERFELHFEMTQVINQSNQSQIDAKENAKKNPKNLPVTIWLNFFSFFVVDVVVDKFVESKNKKEIKRSNVVVVVWLSHYLPWHHIQIR